MDQLHNKHDWDNVLRWMKHEKLYSSYDRVLFMVNVGNVGQRGFHWSVVEAWLGSTESAKPARPWKIIYHDSLLPLNDTTSFYYKKGVEYCALACEYLERKLIVDKEVSELYINRHLVWKQRFGQQSVEFPGTKMPPMQENGHDCGVLACLTAECLCLGYSLDTIESTNPKFIAAHRNRILMSIIYEKYFEPSLAMEFLLY